MPNDTTLGETAHTNLTPKRPTTQNRDFRTTTKVKTTRERVWQPNGKKYACPTQSAANNSTQHNRRPAKRGRSQTSGSPRHGQVPPGKYEGSHTKSLRHTNSSSHTGHATQIRFWRTKLLPGLHLLQEDPRIPSRLRKEAVQNASLRSTTAHAPSEVPNLSLTQATPRPLHAKSPVMDPMNPKSS
jgi:hypothetical protein